MSLISTAMQLVIDYNSHTSFYVYIYIYIHIRSGMISTTLSQTPLGHPAVMGSARHNPGKARMSQDEEIRWFLMDVQWFNDFTYMAMDQYLYIPFLVGWTSICQLFWCSPGVQGFDPSPYNLLAHQWFYLMFQWFLMIRRCSMILPIWPESGICCMSLMMFDGFNTLKNQIAKGS